MHQKQSEYFIDPSGKLFWLQYFFWGNSWYRYPFQLQLSSALVSIQIFWNTNPSSRTEPRAADLTVSVLPGEEEFYWMVTLLPCEHLSLPGPTKACGGGPTKVAALASNVCWTWERPRSVWAREGAVVINHIETNPFITHKPVCRCWFL